MVPPRLPNGQFPPKTSGNPRGRPRRSDSQETALVATLPSAPSAPTRVVTRRDGWVNGATGHGTRRDRRRLTEYDVDIVTDIEALFLWRSEFLAAKIIEDGPREGYRRPWHLKCEDKELAEKIVEDCKRVHATKQVVRSAMFENAYGGGAIFPVINGSQPPLSEKLDEGAIASVEALHVFEPRELTPEDYYTDINSPKFRRPMTYRVNPLTSGRGSYFATTVIHESRLIIMPGTTVSVETQPGERLGWGDSALCRPKQLISDFGLAWGSAATLLHNHGKETLEMKGLANIMGQADGVQEFDRYLEAMWSAWSTLRMNVIDSESRISRSTGTLAGVAELLNEFKVLMAAACNRPVSVLMGQSQSGLRTGDDDTRTWYATVERDRADRWHHALERIVRLIMLATAGPTGGTAPEMWSIEYPALWSPSDKERADTQYVDMQKAGLAVDKGIASADDVAESFYKGDTYSGDIHIDWERREAQQAMAQVGPGDLSAGDRAAMGGDEDAGGEDLSDDELAELQQLQEEFGTEDGGLADDDESEDDELDDED